MNSIIFDIQRNSFVDGPGIRTTVFFKGCNLKCSWCHNPESQNPRPQMLFYKDKCTGCGRCTGITEKDTDFICFNDAKQLCGKLYTIDEIFAQVIKDKAFYENSGGGVTFSGGECMLQIDFLCAILKKCHENGIHTAVDTAGHVPWEYFQKIIPYTDLFLFDIKVFDTEIHKKYTGISNDLLLGNLKKLFKQKAHIWIRIPIIPAVNDTMDEMIKIKDFLKPFNPEKIELLPYHKLGEHKYDALSIKMTSFETPSTDLMEKLKNIFK